MWSNRFRCVKSTLRQFKHGLINGQSFRLFFFIVCVCVCFLFCFCFCCVLFVLFLFLLCFVCFVSVFVVFCLLLFSFAFSLVSFFKSIGFTFSYSHRKGEFSVCHPWSLLTTRQLFVTDLQTDTAMIDGFFKDWWWSAQGMFSGVERPRRPTGRESKAAITSDRSCEQMWITLDTRWLYGHKSKNIVTDTIEY